MSEQEKNNGILSVWQVGDVIVVNYVIKGQKGCAHLTAEDVHRAAEEQKERPRMPWDKEEE